MKEFKLEKNQLFRPQVGRVKGRNGMVTIIGGSELFHGAPLMSLKVASRVVDMVFFASPEPSVGKVAEHLKSKLYSFIWIPWEKAREYIKKSDAILIGPGLMRYRKKERKDYDEVGKETKKITEKFLQEFPDKQWVIDAGSLQVMDVKFIPKMAILTPSRKEYRMLFGEIKPEKAAKKYGCIIDTKGAETVIYSPEECRLVKGGNPGLIKGGTGDVLAGLDVALVAQNPPFLAACAASWIVKRTADILYEKVGLAYNADDLAEKIPEVLGEYIR